MDVLVIFSGESLKRNLSELQKREQEKGKVIFHHILVIGDDDKTLEDLDSIYNRIHFVPGNRKSFKTIPYAFYFFCVDEGNKVLVAEIAGFLQRSNNPWKAFENVFDIFRNSPVIR